MSLHTIGTMRLIPILMLMAGVMCGQTRVMPLGEVKAGMVATGRTVFAGDKVEEFKAEILGVLENVGPKQSIILARLSGGPLDRTGVLQGMSGSPVYYEGRLMGAVAMSFPFSKEPIAGIRPMEEMLLAASTPATPPRAERPGNPFDLAALLPRAVEVAVGPARMTEIATPFWMTGFTRGAFEHFAPMLRAAGLEPVQGLSAGQSAGAGQVGVKAPEPGSMISVQLISGDLAAGADGTVTHVDGKTVYAFGHRFLSTGDSEMPFARAEVMTLLASQNVSFKISAVKETLGVITQDRSAAIAGVLGAKAVLTPVTIRLRSRTGVEREHTYRMNVVRDRLLTPLLLQMAVFSAIDATERTAGVATLDVKARIDLGNGQAPIPFQNVYTAELAAPQMAAGAVAAPVMALMQSGFERLEVSGIHLDIEVTNDKRQLQIENFWASKREARPGETVQLTALFTGDNGREMTRTINYTIPVGAQLGPLYFTVADGAQANLAEYRHFIGAPPKTEPQLLEFLRGLRPNTKAYVRVWRSAPSWLVQGETLPAPPPSLTLLLGRTQTQSPGAKVDELEMAAGGYMMTGARTIAIEVKE